MKLIKNYKLGNLGTQNSRHLISYIEFIIKIYIAYYCRFYVLLNIENEICLLQK